MKVYHHREFGRSVGKSHYVSLESCVKFQRQKVTGKEVCCVPSTRRKPGIARGQGQMSPQDAEKWCDGETSFLNAAGGAIHCPEHKSSQLFNCPVEMALEYRHVA